MILTKEQQAMLDDAACTYLKDFGAAGAILADVWVEGVTMPVVDSLGDEFLDYVKDGMKITVNGDGTVTVE